MAGEAEMCFIDESAVVRGGFRPALAGSKEANRGLFSVSFSGPLL
jgi:hypothetical protein